MEFRLVCGFAAVGPPVCADEGFGFRIGLDVVLWLLGMMILVRTLKRVTAIVGVGSVVGRHDGVIRLLTITVVVGCVVSRHDGRVLLQSSLFPFKLLIFPPLLENEVFEAKLVGRI